MEDARLFRDEEIQNILQDLQSPSEIRKWARQNGLMTHPLVLDKLRFQCTLCDKSYLRLEKLQQHVDSKHRNIPLYQMSQDLSSKLRETPAREHLHWDSTPCNQLFSRKSRRTAAYIICVLSAACPCTKVSRSLI